MRWNCPHCQTALSASDSQLTTDWSYARCFYCGNFSLVRKDDPNAVRVDSHPFAESAQAPEFKLSRQALKHLGELQEKAAAKAAARAEMRASRQEILAQAGIPSRPAALNKPVTPPQFSPQNIVADSTPPPFPKPLPEPPRGNKGWVRRLFSTFLPGLVPILALLSIGGGLALFKYGRDQIKASASAPQRSPAVEAPILAQEAKPAMAPAAQAPAVRTQTVLDSVPTLTDEVDHRAAAPRKAPLKVRISADTAILRSGPGTNYAPIAKAKAGMQYGVISFRDNWFRVTEHGWVRNDLVEMIDR